MVRAHLEIRGQLMGVGSLLLSLGSNSDQTLGLAASVFTLQATLPACIYLFLFTFEFCSVEIESKSSDMQIMLSH